MAYDFKREEEVKQFLDNIGTEYRFSCFKEKNAEGCHLLGDYLESVKREFEAAAKVYKSNCEELKYPKSCLKYGSYSYLGKGVEQNNFTALDYYKKACNLDSPDACLNAGVMLTVNEDDKNKSDSKIQRNLVEGLKYLEKSCSMGNATACYFGSGIYMKGIEEIPRNFNKAAELSLRACDGGNIYACMNVSRMYKVGDGLEKDEQKSIEFKERAKEIRDDMRRKRSIGLQQIS